MNRQLLEYVDSLKHETAQIPDNRREKLDKLSELIRTGLRNKDSVRLNFICTHNSRRSQLGQIWAATLANYFGLEGLETFSGGTEASAFNPRAVEAVIRAGFTVENPGGENPRYKVFFGEASDPLICYSKLFDDESNPAGDFIAVMTCSDADRNCPVVPGTQFRITIPYEDPKLADGTPQESRIYDERCLQIASEMYYMLSRLN